MRTLEKLIERSRKYRDLEYIYDEQVGYIAWHMGTGDNVELLFIEVAEQRKGYGTALIRRMCEWLKLYGKEPYHSLFGFRLASNDKAAFFYYSLGWKQKSLGESIYKGDETWIMWTPWEDMLKKLGLQ